jgi:Uncharacterised protein family (UPF0175)
MTSISLNLPDTAFSALRKTPKDFGQEMRIAPAVKWYALEQIPQAEIASLTRAEFFLVIGSRLFNTVCFGELFTSNHAI